MIKFHFELPELGYQFGDLAPMMSQETLAFHYGKHFQTYVDNLNRLVDGSKYEGLSLCDLVRKAPEGPIADNAGQVLNHMLFFEQLSPAQNAKQPTGEFRFLTEQSFGSFEAMIEQLDIKNTESVKCPSCGSVINLDEEMLEEGSMVCPKCGEDLEFDETDELD